MHRVALTADLQLQPQPRYSTLSSSGITTRLQDFIDCLHWVADTAVQHECDTLFVLGDLFDSRTVIDVTVIDRACRAFREIAKKIAVHVMVGNHDAYLRTPRMNSMQMLAGVATVHETVVAVGPFAVVPWTDNPEDYHTALQRAAKLKTPKGKPSFLLSHGMFGEAVPMAKGLPLEWLTEGGWRGVFLGDVHDPVVLQKSPIIRYVGSPLQIHFGDAGRDRGFVVLDTQKGTHKFITNDRSPRFHIIETVDDIPEPTTDRDFLRVKAHDLDLSEVLAAEAAKVSPWVEVESSATHTENVRIEAAGSLSDEDLLRAYCKHVAVDADLLVPLGLELLQEARE
jgi:DNA repair exonuclease SbcCD nuclease subunit